MSTESERQGLCPALKNGIPLGPGGHGAPLHKIGIVTGLRAERKLALELSPSAVAGGGQPEGARAAAEHLIANGAKALLSFGLAGGLDPACRPGHLAIPRRVVSAIGTWATDPTLTTACGGATIDTLYAGQAIAATASQKAELHHLTGAAAIDLESGEVAAAAARHNLPFAVLRAICDPAERDLPPAALAALDSSGIISIGRVLLSLLRQPSQLPLLLALSHDAAAARAALKRRAEEQGKIRHASQQHPPNALRRDSPAKVLCFLSSQKKSLRR